MFDLKKYLPNHIMDLITELHNAKRHPPSMPSPELIEPASNVKSELLHAGQRSDLHWIPHEATGSG